MVFAAAAVAQQALAGAKPVGSRADALAAVREGFASPPIDARPMMRWWWFGSVVDKARLAHDLRTMKEGGIGGAEIQPVYPLALDDASKGFQNMPYISKEFLDMVSFAAQTAEIHSCAAMNA